MGGTRRATTTPDAVRCSGLVQRSLGTAASPRVEQCAAILRAELVYDKLLRENELFGPGRRLVLEWKLDGSSTSWEAEAEVLANVVWRRGRLFLRCKRCERRANRLLTERRTQRHVPGTETGNGCSSEHAQDHQAVRVPRGCARPTQCAKRNSDYGVRPATFDHFHGREQ